MFNVCSELLKFAHSPLATHSSPFVLGLETTFRMHVGQIARRSAYQVYARLALSLLCLQVSRPCSNFNYFASQLEVDDDDDDDDAYCAVYPSHSETLDFYFYG